MRLFDSVSFFQKYIYCKTTLAEFLKQKALEVLDSVSLPKSSTFFLELQELDKNGPHRSFYGLSTQSKKNFS